MIDTENMAGPENRTNDRMTNKTEINVFQDILEALEQHPELRAELRRHILTEELLQLPAMVLAMRAEIQELQAGQERLEAGQQKLDDRVKRIEGFMGNVTGDRYETRVQHKMNNRAHRLGIEGAQIAMSNNTQTSHQLHTTMMNAIASNLVTDEEHDEMSYADLIIRGKNQRHILAEISLGPDSVNIDRASRRAEILHRATGDEVIPVIIAPNPHPEFIRQANERGVETVAIQA